MSYSLVCDSCAQPIGVNDLGQVNLPSEGSIAGAGLHLCRTCMAGVSADPKIKKAKATFDARRRAAETAISPGTPATPQNAPA